MRRKLLKQDNYKRGDRVYAYDTKKQRELFKGTIVRISNDKKTMHITRDDLRYSEYSILTINGKRTWKIEWTGDFWSAYPDGYGRELTYKMYSDTVDNWKAYMGD